MSVKTSPYDWIESSLETIHKANWYRAPRVITGQPGPVVQFGGRSLLNFASNDYLGLAGDKRLKKAAIAAIKTHGTGSTGSRLLSGHRSVHEELEGAIATFKQTESALVFSSGYLTNLGTITALVGPRDLIVADEYNHASLKNGAKLSGAKTFNYRHGDLDDLKIQLKESRNDYRRCLLLTDSVFSMDGDLCPLPGLLDLADQHDCMVLVDEAHGTGVLGPTGAGCVEHFGCSDTPLIQMGTLSKALGSLGGYVAGSAPLIDYLRNRASTWIYTTGLSPADTAAALAAIQVIQAEPQRREQLWQRVAQLKALMSEIPKVQDGTWTLLPSDSPIVCLQMQSPKVVLNVSQQLLEQGIFAPAIRPPTVPTSRIRISVMATHQPEQIEALVMGLRSL
ncbi:MAG: 8-amino-7-oxononanoate synthase [Thermosynechococcaceae cyanobacterium]